MLHCLSGEHLHTLFGILLLSLQFYMHAIIRKAGFMDTNQSPMALFPVPLSESEMQDKSSEETVL